MVNKRYSGRFDGGKDIENTIAYAPSNAHMWHANVIMVRLYWVYT
jgi:hypothetical protein